MSFPERASAAIASRGGPASRPVSPVGPGADRDAGWMRRLCEHYERTRRSHPSDELAIVFDIDGTIIDVRHLVVHVLLAYDRTQGTDLFRGLVADDVVHHEDDLDGLFGSLAVPASDHHAVATFYRSHLWHRDAVLAASRPYEGVFGVIRWFQLQPHTHVALNTGRSHRMRIDTLDSLNTVGSSHRVRFEPDLLFTADDDGDVPAAKVRAMRELRRRGLRVVAVVDNEPDNLRAMAADDPDGRILFLHADTIFRSQRPPQDRLVAGRDYRLRELVPQRSLPDRVTFVWHGVNDRANLDAFLASDVRWAEIDVRRDPVGRLVLRHDGFEDSPWRRREAALLASDAIAYIAASGRSLKLDLKEGGPTLADASALVDAHTIGEDRLWLNAELPTLGEDGFAAIRRRFPGAIISAPVDPLVPLLRASRSAADHTLALLRSWGISRLSLRWDPWARELLDRLEAAGWPVNLYGIPDLEAFLDASLMLPASITADFNFPEWHYYGRGSGEGGYLPPGRDGAVSPPAARPTLEGSGSGSLGRLG